MIQEPRRALFGAKGKVISGVALSTREANKRKQIGFGGGRIARM
jgi:hypothetical protein